MPASNPVISKIRAVGVSGPYASQIATGARKPSLPLAIRIFKATGLKFGALESRSEKEISALTEAQKVLGRAVGKSRRPERGGVAA